MTVCGLKNSACENLTAGRRGKSKCEVPWRCADVEMFVCENMDV